MLTNEKRQAIQSLILNPNINSVQIMDGKFPSGLVSSLTIFVTPCADHFETLQLIATATGATFQKRPMDDGDLHVTYEPTIDGLSTCISAIYFNETNKKAPVDAEVQEKLLQDYSKIDWTTEVAHPSSQGATEKNTLLNGITEWTIEEIMRREG